MTLPGPDSWSQGASAAALVGERSPDILRQRAAATPEATGFVDADSGERWTYAAFDQRVAARAARLAGEFEVGDGRVGLLFGTRIAFADLYFAVQRVGATAVPLNVALTADALRDQVERAALDCLVCGAETETLATDVAPTGVPVASVDPVRDESVRSLTVDADSGRDARRAGQTGRAATPVPLDHEALVMFTSGTTGRPKGVRLTRRNLVASALGSAHRLGVEPGDRWLVCLPTYHMGGLAPVVRSTLYGTTAVLQREFDTGATARVMTERNVTAVSLVPTMLTRLLDADWSPPDSLRFVLLGGAPASPALLERALDRDLPVCPTYGLTETASQVATATPDDVAADPETVGRPLRGTDVTLLDADGDPVEPGSVGELVVDGPTVAPGYLDGDRTEAAFGPAGLQTGDLASRDEAGRLRIRGRVDDRIVTGGENVAPERVASALRDHPEIREAAVVGLPDEEWGERVATLVVPAAATLSAGSVREYARDSLADFAVPKTVAFADSLPRTASGTVDRETVVDLLDEAEG